ncbi:hypothetical protein [Microbacterium maritypicum]
MTAINAASLLDSFFRADNKRAFDPRYIVMAVIEIESHVDLWEQAGSNVTPFREALPIWRAEVFHYIDPNDGRFANYGESNNFGTGVLGLLGWAAERIASTTPETSEAVRSGIREMVQEARNTLVEDTSLPERLRVHVTRVLRHVEEALDNYDITGEFLLEDALERLLGVLGIVENASKEPSRWQKFREAFTPGFAAELASSGSMQGMAAIASAITGG